MKQINYCLLIVKILNRLSKSNPTYNIGKHISTATDGFDLWGVTDKELFLSLKEYEESLNTDVTHNDEEIDAIIKDGMNLRITLFEEE